MSELEQYNDQSALVETSDIKEKMKSIFEDGTASNTLRAYKSDINYFMNWCDASNISSELPFSKEALIKFIVEHSEGMPEDVDAILCDRGFKSKNGTHKISTLDRRVAAISSVHKSKNLENPCDTHEIKTLMKKVRRAAATRGYKPQKKSATTADILQEMTDTCGFSPIDIRDKALLLFAFSSGGRRASEVNSAQIEDIYQVPDGFIYSLGKTKTDQTGKEDLKVPILGKAGKALKEWIDLIDADEGPLFRAIAPNGKPTKNGITTKTVSNIVKKRAELAGYNPKDFASHSMRSGFITEGGRQNINIFQLMELSGHKSMQVAKGYYRTGNLENNPASRLLDD